jgi:hypothetical protein
MRSESHFDRVLGSQRIHPHPTEANRLATRYLLAKRAAHLIRHGLEEV